MTDAAQHLAPEHPLRRAIADEVHARTSAAVETPSRATYVAMLIAPDDRARELEHLGALCRRFDRDPPAPTSTHFSVPIGDVTLIWNRHGEFSNYTFLLDGLADSTFDAPATQQLPDDWLSAIPGRTLVAAHASIFAAAEVTVDAEFFARHFGSSVVAGGDVGEGAGSAYTDFRIHADGYSRFLLIDAGFTPRQSGRMLQRLFEIETYRMMALLALPIARQQSAQLTAIEQALADVTAKIALGGGDDEALLHEVTRLAAEVESALTASQFRFSACRAYADLVASRIAELRERRRPGIQPIAEFMSRRFTPAVATCTTVARRLHDLSERIARASGLLSTRVEIARERQNQSLLSSMDRRAKMQLRLQETVEGLSVAAIVYYAAGLVGYVAKAFKSAGAHFEPELVVGISIPILLVLVIVATRRARRRIFGDEHATGPG